MGINLQVSGLVLLLLLSHIGLMGVSNAQLSPTFYDSTCPLAPSIIRQGVFSAIALDPRMGASLLRLHFSDCFVNGCDASVLLDDTADFTGEKTADANNNSLRGFDVIDSIKAQLEAACPGVVSCADILAIAARESVVVLGGVGWLVRLGRRDSTTASLSDANNQIPSHESNLDALISAFDNKGFTPREMVALSGAHTIGMARCSTVRNRIYTDTNIDPSFAAAARNVCPSSGGDERLLTLDATTPNSFDNFYFRNLVAQRGLLHSDQQLFTGGSTDSFVQQYSSSPPMFFNDFNAAMIKMSELSPLTSGAGEIRANCRSFN